MLEPKASPASGSKHMTGKGGHARNWACACKPGILGPPVSPLPAMLLTTIEQLGCGPPSSWKLSQESTGTNLELKWTMNNGQSLNKFAMFPPPLLTAIASLQSPPSFWSLEQVNTLLCCCLTWTTTSVPAPDSPAPLSSTLNDSGYSSPPASPTSPSTTPVSSPIPFDLSTDAASQTTQAEVLT